MQAKSRDLLISIANSLGKPPLIVEPYIKILEANWYDTVDSLAKIPEEFWEKNNFPTRVVQMIKEKIPASGKLVGPTNDPTSQFQANKGNNPDLEKLFSLLGQEIKSKPDYVACVQTIQTILNNILKDPNDIKKRKIKKSNKKFFETVGKYPSGLQILYYAGYKDLKDMISFDEKDPKKTNLPLVLDKVVNEYNKSSSEPLTNFNPFQSSFTGLVPTKLGLTGDEYNNDLLKKFIDSENAKREKALATVVTNRNPVVFAIKPGVNLKNSLTIMDKEVEAPTEIDSMERANVVNFMNQNEKNSQFRSKAKIALEEAQKKPIYYKCIIRIKFPDNTLLQGDFGCLDQIQKLYQYVSQNIVYGNAPFTLFVTPPRKNLEKMTDIFNNLNMVPTATVYFEYKDPMYQAKNEYLKKDTVSKYLKNFY